VRLRRSKAIEREEVVAEAKAATSGGLREVVAEAKAATSRELRPKGGGAKGGAEGRRRTMPWDRSKRRSARWAAGWRDSYSARVVADA
jgi:ribosome modulation factor